MISFSEFLAEDAIKDILIKYADAIELMSKLKYDDEVVMDILAKLAKIKNPQKAAVTKFLKANDIKDADISKIVSKIVGV